VKIELGRHSESPLILGFVLENTAQNPNLALENGTRKDHNLRDQTAAFPVESEKNEEKRVGGPDCWVESEAGTQRSPGSREVVSIIEAGGMCWPINKTDGWRKKG